MITKVLIIVCYMFQTFMAKEICEDFGEHSQNCPKWAETGLCEGQFDVFMKTFCQWSCKTCGISKYSYFLMFNLRKEPALV